MNRGSSNDPALGCATEQARLREVLATIERAHEEFLVEAEAHAAIRAEAARAGQHGPDAQRLQRRLDSGETSVEALRDGVDRDPSAVRARETFQHVLHASVEER